MPEQCADVDLLLMDRKLCHCLDPQPRNKIDLHSKGMKDLREDIGVHTNVSNIQEVCRAIGAVCPQCDFRMVAASHFPTPILDCTAGQNRGPHNIDYGWDETMGIETNCTGEGRHMNGETVAQD
jgi:hypothetical protein